MAVSSHGRSLSQPSWSAKADHPRVCLLPMTAFDQVFSAFLRRLAPQDVDARDKPEHDGRGNSEEGVFRAQASSKTTGNLDSQSI
jgi:hypothetical protein